MAGADKTIIVLVLLSLIGAFLFSGTPDVTDGIIHKLLN